MDRDDGKLLCYAHSTYGLYISSSDLTDTKTKTAILLSRA